MNKDKERNKETARQPREPNAWNTRPALALAANPAPAKTAVTSLASTASLSVCCII